MENLKGKFVKSVIWLGSAKFLGQGFSWLVTIFLVRLLAPQDFGVVAMVSAYQAIVVIVYDLNLGAALVQQPVVDRKIVHTTFWSILGLGIVMYILTVLLAPYVARFFNNEKVAGALVVYALGSVFQSIQQVPYWLMSKELDFDKRAKAELVSSIISLIISLVLAVHGYGLWSLVYGFVSKNFFQAILICLLFQWKEFFSWDDLFSFSWRSLMPLLQFSVPLTGFYFLRYLFMRSDAVIVGRWLGDKSLGYYSVALDLARIPVDKFVTIINQVCFPVFSQLQNDLSMLRRYFLKTTEFVSLMVFPVSVGAALLSKELVLLILTEKWQPITSPFICLCFVAILQSLVGVLFMLLNALGQSRVNFKFSLIAACILPVSFVIGVQYGIIGVALSWVIVYPILFMYLLHRALLEINCGLREFLRAIKMPACGALVMAFAVLTIKLTIGIDTVSVGGLLLCILAGGLTYVAYICRFSPEAIDDIKTIYRELCPTRATVKTK